MKLSNKQKEVIALIGQIGEIRKFGSGVSTATFESLYKNGLIKEKTIFSVDGIFYELTELGKSIKL